MRRFIVEVVIDTVLLAVILLVLGVISVSQPFPFGTGTRPIVALRGAGLIGFASLGGGPRPGQPVRAARSRRADRPTPVLDDGPVRRDHQRDRDLAHLGHRADQDRHRRRPDAGCGSSSAAALYTALSTVVDAVLGLNRPDLGRRPEPRDLGLPRIACRRHVATSIIENLRLQQVYNAIYTTSLDIALADTPVGPIRRWFARVVLGETDDFVDADGPARIGRCSSSSARPT